VIVYGLQASDFLPLFDKYEHARRFLASHASVNVEYQAPDRAQAAHQMFAYDVVKQQPFCVCASGETIGGVVRRMNSTGARAVALMSEAGQVTGVITGADVLRWIGDGGDDLASSAGKLARGGACTAPSSATVSECILRMSEAGADAVAITEDGSPAGRLVGVAAAADLSLAFSEQPLSILQDIAHAPSMAVLRRLNLRARGFLLEQLASPLSVDWLTRYTHRVDAAILTRVLDFVDWPAGECSWCFAGAAGRQEALTLTAPETAVILRDEAAQGDYAAAYARIPDALSECGYVPAPASPPDPAFGCATLREWSERFRAWVRDPVRTRVYEARPLFDLGPAFGPDGLWRKLESTAAAEIRGEPSFVLLLANDSLANLPPLTFFRDLVVDEAGEQAGVFHLEQSALQPLVDAGRVLGIVAGQALGASSLERFALARTAMPEHESIFREAAETLRVMLYHQGRAGIRQRDGGAELSPALLSRYDRQVLKSGFRSILRLLEFIEGRRWMEAA
jgi:CBS domain-containing protein